MKKILSIMALILFLSFGFSLRESVKKDKNLEVKNAMEKYEEATVELSKMDNELEKKTELNNKDIANLDEVKAKYDELLKAFDEYKLSHPSDINDEIRKLKEENDVYSNEVAQLEGDLDKLNINIVKQQQVISNSSSSNNNKQNSSTGSNNSNSSVGSSNSNESSASGGTVYANGGSSKSNKYHSKPTAHNMEGAIPMSESEAKSSGYVACKVCY